MLVHPWDAGRDEAEWRGFVRATGFGHLVAAGRGREVPVVVPTQFLLREPGGTPGREPAPEVVLHLARPNPVFAAIAQNPTVLLSVAGDWAYVPTHWRAIGTEDPALGIPTTLYAAVQLVARAHLVDDPAGKAAILREQLADLEPAGDHADPAVHARQLAGIRGLRLAVTDVTAKFKYAGNVDAAHREAIATRLAERARPGDRAARAHLLRRS